MCPMFDVVARDANVSNGLRWSDVGVGVEMERVIDVRLNGINFPMFAGTSVGWRGSTGCWIGTTTRTTAPGGSKRTRIR